MAPADAGDEKARAERDRVDERRAQIGLLEDKQNRQEREADCLEDDPQLV